MDSGAGTIVATQWYYQMMGEPRGPVTPDELKQLAINGTVTRESFLRRQDMEDWVSAARVDQLWRDVEERPVASLPAPPPNPSAPKRPVPPPKGYGYEGIVWMGDAEPVVPKPAASAAAAPGPAAPLGELPRLPMKPPADYLPLEMDDPHSPPLPAAPLSPEELAEIEAEQNLAMQRLAKTWLLRLACAWPGGIAVVAFAAILEFLRTLDLTGSALFFLIWSAAASVPFIALGVLCVVAWWCHRGE